jgi:hypothetical protein
MVERSLSYLKFVRFLTYPIALESPAMWHFIIDSSQVLGILLEQFEDRRDFAKFVNRGICVFWLQPLRITFPNRLHSSILGSGNICLWIIADEDAIFSRTTQSIDRSLYKKFLVVAS